MATYIVLVDFTAEGFGRIQETTRRCEDIIEHVKGLEKNVEG